MPREGRKSQTTVSLLFLLPNRLCLSSYALLRAPAAEFQAEPPLPQAICSPTYYRLPSLLQPFDANNPELVAQAFFMNLTVCRVVCDAYLALPWGVVDPFPLPSFASSAHASILNFWVLVCCFLYVFPRFCLSVPTFLRTIEMGWRCFLVVLFGVGWRRSVVVLCRAGRTGCYQGTRRVFGHVPM